jgi:DNA (cytosine-5)-methyltransferase 1
VTLTIGSLFSGIGGLDLGLERATGARTAWQVEIDPFCRRVLERHWPEALRYDDIKTFPTPTTPRVDIICGGFPCQDLSVAGSGAGLDGARSGLFFELARVVRALRPRVVVLENVSGLLARGLGRVLGELAACGYDAEWDCVPASAVGAPHQRDRIWIVAYPQRDGGGEQPERDQREGRGARAPERGHADALHDGAARDASDAEQPGLERATGGGDDRAGRTGILVARCDWGQPPSAIRRVDDGFPSGVDRPRWRRPVNDKHRLHALGNAVVPQVAEVIGRRVAEIL